MRGAWVLTAGCALAVAVLVWAEWRDARALRAVAKTAASTAFIGVALALGATGSLYGRWVLAALALSWAGDVLLLAPRTFLAGLGAFLLAHVAYAVAFARAGVDGAWTAGGAVAMAAVGAAVLRWLWPHLGSAYRGAVAAYVVAIGAMVAAAVGHAAAAGHGVVAAGAVAFAASDVAVARDRFVAPGWGNRAWGLPLYYAAQLALAWTVA